MSELIKKRVRKKENERGGEVMSWVIALTDSSVNTSNVMTSPPFSLAPHRDPILPSFPSSLPPSFLPFFLLPPSFFTPLWPWPSHLDLLYFIRPFYLLLGFCSLMSCPAVLLSLFCSCRPCWTPVALPLLYTLFPASFVPSVYYIYCSCLGLSPVFI